MNANSDTTAAIDSLENLLKAKIKLQDAQSEAEPLLQVIGLLFEPEVLNDDQKNVLRNGLKSLRKLLEAHATYSEAVQQAEPARVIVNQLLSSQPKGLSTNGKPSSSPLNESVSDEAPDEAIADEITPDEAVTEETVLDKATPDEPKAPAAIKAPSSTKAASSKKS
jgi:hypothetical protein